MMEILDLFYAPPNTVCDGQLSVLRRGMRTHSFGRVEEKQILDVTHTHTRRGYLASATVQQ